MQMRVEDIAEEALIPNLDEAAMNRIIETTKEPGFNPRQLETEIQSIVSAIKSATPQ
jgi:hypothetical protein